MTFLLRSTKFRRVASRHFPRRSTQTRCASGTAPGSLLRKPVEGKHDIVTGSSQGIGKSIALRLALDGYNVCINDIPGKEKACDGVVDEIKSMGRKAVTAVGDVSKRNDVKDLMKKSVRELGPLHTM